MFGDESSSLSLSPQNRILSRRVQAVLGDRCVHGPHAEWAVEWQHPSLVEWWSWLCSPDRRELCRTEKVVPAVAVAVAAAAVVVVAPPARGKQSRWRWRRDGLESARNCCVDGPARGVTFAQMYPLHGVAVYDAGRGAWTAESVPVDGIAYAVVVVLETGTVAGP